MAIADILNEAVHHHQNGQLDQAETLYRQALELNPQHAGLHHCLGMIASQTQRCDLAIEHLKKALELAPGEAQFHNTLGIVLEETGRKEEAIEAYAQAIDLNPTFAEAYNNLAIAWQGLGEHDKAVASGRQAVTLMPDHSGFHNTLGYSLKMLGRNEEALESFKTAAKLEPNHPEPLNHMGAIYTELAQYDQAISCLARATLVATDYAEAYNHLGMAYHGAGRLGDAIGALKQALALEPDFIQARYNLANTLSTRGLCDQAIDSFRICLEQDPDYALAHWNLSHALLLNGQYEEGWTHYAWRHHADLDITTYPYALEGSKWEGQPFPDQRLLVHFEQGYGDSLQFARFLPEVKALGGTVIMQVRKPLARVFENIDGIDELTVVDDTGVPEPIDYDLHVSLVDLPGHLKVTVDSLDGSPYIHCPKDLSESWRSRITSEKFKVGIVWAGSPKHGNDTHRSCNLDHWAPLMDLPGICWVSLQKGPGATALQEAAFSQEIVDLNDSILDFADTSAIIDQLDLVITVDTSVAHLAGAMGKPTWVLLPHAPDWRWMRNRSDSPWYDTVTLFRQRPRGRWQDVMGDMASKLTALAGSEPADVPVKKTGRAVPVIIPAYKNKTQLDNCKEHLSRQTVPCNIFVRDNSEDNVFFTAAVNEGIRHFLQTDAPYILVLNQDMYLEPNAVEALTLFMDSHPKCGICAPLQLHHETPDQVIWGGSLDAFPNGVHRVGPVSQYPEPSQVIWVNGACMMLRKEMVQDIGLLDKNLAFVGSDSDYSFTARARGWELWCVPAARGRHEHGASGSSPDPFLQNRKVEDMIYFGKKWLSGDLYRDLSAEKLDAQTVEKIMGQLRDARL